MKESIDITRCLRAMNFVNVTGIPSNAGRRKLIEEAIGAFQLDPENALLDEYLGIKNYAAFGDQRCDCRYGQGPAHGSIVFAIRRKDVVDELPVSDVV